MRTVCIKGMYEFLNIDIESEDVKVEEGTLNEVAIDEPEEPAERARGKSVECSRSTVLVLLMSDGGSHAIPLEP